MSVENLIIENGIVTGYRKKAAHLVIPEGITKIGEGVFKNCLWLNSVSIESSVFTSIGDDAFNGCSCLETVTMKALRGAIGARAFQNCSQLKKMDIPSGAMEIGAGAFTACANLTYVAIPASVMVIADTAFETVTSQLLLILVQKNSEAAKYAEKKNIPYRENSNFVRSGLEAAQKARELLETRTFDIFGHKITASNSLALHVDIQKHYNQSKDPFYNSFLKHLPSSPTGTISGVKAGEDMDRLIQATISRLEKHGIYITKDTISSFILSAYSNIATILKSTNEFRNKILEIGEAHLDNYKEQLIEEAESKVTGLSYTVIGDPLSLAAHAIDDYRERQRQRKSAYDSAQQQYDAHQSQTNSELNAAFTRFLDNTVKPALRTGVAAFMDVLCNVEIGFLKKHGLLEEIPDGTYNAVRSTEIIHQASKMDNKEYAVGLALKTYPLNLEAYTFAGKNNLATDELLGLAAFMGIEDEATLHAVLGSTKVSIKKLIHLCAENSRPIYKKMLRGRCISISMQIDALLDKKCRTMSAEEIQKQLESIISVDLWHDVFAVMPLLVSLDVLRSIKKSSVEVETVEGYQKLGEYIAQYHANQANADTLASNIETVLDWQDKVGKTYEIKETLGKDRINQLLSKDVEAAATELLKGDIPEYTGTNKDKIQSAIRQEIDKQWKEETVRYIKEMDVPVFSGKITNLYEKLAAQYIESEQKRLAVQLENEQKRLAAQLENELKKHPSDFSAALMIGRSYIKKIPAEQVRKTLTPYYKQVDDIVSAFQKNPNVPKGAALAKSKEIAQAAMDEMMPQEAWEMLGVKYKEYSSNMQKAVEQEIQYRKAYAAYKKASNIDSFQKAYELFDKVGDDYKKCKARKDTCSQQIQKLKKRARRRKIFAISALVVILAVLIATVLPNVLYNKAVAYMNAGNSDKAYRIFYKLDEIYSSLGHESYKDAKSNMIALEEKERPFTEVTVGSTIRFGRYEQNGIKGDSLEPIEWIVLTIDESNSKALLVSKMVLDSQCFHSYGYVLSFADSSLYAWLQDSFVPAAFTDLEQSYINGAVTIPSSDDDSQYSIPSAKHTEYAKSVGDRGVNRDEGSWPVWKSDEPFNGHACIGFKSYYTPNQYKFGVQPMIWVNVK